MESPLSQRCVASFDCLLQASRVVYIRTPTGLQSCNQKPSRMTTTFQLPAFPDTSSVEFATYYTRMKGLDDIPSCSSLMDSAGSFDGTCTPTESCSSLPDQLEEPLTLERAIQETEQSIFYTNGPFPRPGVSYADQRYLTPEALVIGEGVKLQILEDMDPVVRVRILHTGECGVVPGHLCETPMERLARLNTLENEIFLCPLESSSRSEVGSPGSLKYRHAHHICQQQLPKEKLATIPKEENEPGPELESSSPRLDSPEPRQGRQAVDFKETSDGSVYRYANPIAPGPKIRYKSRFSRVVLAEDEQDPDPSWDEGWYQDRDELKSERETKLSEELDPEQEQEQEQEQDPEPEPEPEPEPALRFPEPPKVRKRDKLFSFLR